MKDLANLYYFEKLLEDVNNDLVRQAQAKGDIAIGAVFRYRSRLLICREAFR